MNSRMRAEPRPAGSGPALPARWSTVRSAPADGAHNMAVDEALRLRAARTGTATVRVYEWERPTVSFGRNEATRGRWDADALAAAGVDAVRRPTGGRALLHAAEVTYSVTLPLHPSIGWTVAYAAVNRRLLLALRSLGVDATLAPEGAGAPVLPDGPLCFDAPAPGEVVVGGAKLVGSAVWRDRHAYLQHGSILLRDTQATLHALASARESSPLPPPPAAAALESLLPGGAATRASIEAALFNAFAGDRRNGGAGSVTDPGDETSFLADVSRLANAYRAPDWLWRR